MHNSKNSKSDQKNEKNFDTTADDVRFEWTEKEKSELEFGKQLGYIFAAVTCAIYVRTMHPTVAGGDSGELMGVACELGVAHPPVRNCRMTP